MRRSTPSSSGSGGDRATMPGVGEDPRDTLPEPQPPAIAPNDFSRTIPMGSALTSEWLASQIGNTYQSGVHAVNEPPSPVTKSDRVPSHHHKHATLASFGSVPPPRIETDDKRWIGSAVDQGFSTTQRSFSAAPPPADSHSTAGKTLHMTLTAPSPESLGSTLRVMSVPPPAQGVVPRPVSSNPPPPIKPAPTISISPEISISGTRAAEPSTASTPAQPPPLPKRPAANTATPNPNIAPSASPELKPTSNPPIAAKAAGTAQDRLPGGVSTRLLGIGLVVAIVAIASIVLLTRPSAPPPSIAAATTPVVASPPAPPADLSPTTEIITSPPGAEIVLRGALVANTPARIPRPHFESLYLVRLLGHQPQLVSLSPHSPDTIRIQLQPAPGITAPDPTPSQGNPTPTGQLP